MGVRTFGVFAKQPIPGTVKTRLAAETDDDFAANLYAAFLNDLVERFENAADRRILGFADNGEHTVDFFNLLAKDAYQVWQQPDGALGVRILEYFKQHRQSDDDRIVLIGSDSPTLPKQLIDEAFETLLSRDVVIGPATDGGYYLIGLSKPPGELFKNIEWSGSRVLSQTVDAVERQHYSLEVLTPWYDVDTLEGVRALSGHLNAMRLAGNELCPHTRRVLDTLDDGSEL